MVMALFGGIPGGATRYMNRVLNACGADSGHEVMFKENPEIIRATPHNVEVSWLCNPNFWKFKGTKVLIARAPFNVIRNQYSFDFLGERSLPYFLSDYHFFNYEGLNRLAYFYCHWMQVDAQRIINIHELSEGDLKSVSLDIPYPENIKGVPTNWGTRYDLWTDIDFNAIDDNLVSMLERTAGALGVPLYV